MIVEQGVALIFSSLNNSSIDHSVRQWRKSHGKAKTL